MKKKTIKDLTDEEIINMLEEYGSICEYCPCESFETKDGGSCECPKNVVCYGGDPVYPPCMDIGADDVFKAIVDNFKDRVDLNQEVKRKIGDLTLREIKEICNSREACGGCPLFPICERCSFDTDAKYLDQEFEVKD